MAALLTSYASLPDLGTTAFAELLSTIDAGSFCAFSTAAASCARTKFDVTLIASALAHVASAGADASGVGNTAAVLTTMSKPPKRRTAARTAAAIVLRSVRSNASDWTASAEDE